VKVDTKGRQRFDVVESFLKVCLRGYRDI